MTYLLRTLRKKKGFNMRVTNTEPIYAGLNRNTNTVAFGSKQYFSSGEFEGLLSWDNVAILFADETTLVPITIYYRYPTLIKMLWDKHVNVEQILLDPMCIINQIFGLNGIPEEERDESPMFYALAITLLNKINADKVGAAWAQGVADANEDRL